MLVGRTRERLRCAVRLNESINNFMPAAEEYTAIARLHEDIIDETDHVCSAKLVRWIMRTNGLRLKVKSRFVTTTDSAHAYEVALNRLECYFSAEAQNWKRVADITDICTLEGWLYLCIVQDLSSRRAGGLVNVGQDRQ